MKKIYVEDETEIKFDRCPSKIIDFKPYTLDTIPGKMRVDTLKSTHKCFRLIQENPYKFFCLHQSIEELIQSGRPKATKITKLPYLYLEFEKNKAWSYPYASMTANDRKWADREDPENWEFVVGGGRSAIQSRFFPEVPWEMAHFGVEHGVGGEEVIDKYIEYILSQPCWEGKDTSNLVAEVTLFGWPYAGAPGSKSWGTRKNPNKEALEYNWDRICWCPEVRFNKQEYMEDFVFERPDSFLEASLYKSQDLRKKLYETFVDFMDNNSGVLDHEEVVHEEAVDELFRRIVLDHIDYVRSIYDWEF